MHTPASSLPGSSGFTWPTSFIGAVHPFSPKDRAREQAQQFVALARASLDGISYQEAKSLLDVSSHQAETVKSMLEEMGLLFVPHGSGQIRLTAAGKQLFDLIGTGPLAEAPDIKRRVDAVICWSLANCQINRPQSRGSPRPADLAWTTCDIRPYAAFWQAMLDLDGYVTVDEFFGVLCHVHTVDRFEAAIHTIREGRPIARSYIDPRRFARGGDLFNPRIYWLSHLTCGYAVLDIDDDGRISFGDGSRELLEAILGLSRGCGGADVSFRARTYQSTEEYFLDLAGRATPTFLLSGAVRLMSFDDQNVRVLSPYALTDTRADTVAVLGGAELCSLPLRAVCYHSDVPGRLLRLDAKRQLSDGSIELELGMARPVRHRPGVAEFISGYGDNA